MTNRKLFIGIDVGTQGARVELLDDAGARLATSAQRFELTVESREQQDPEIWWAAVLNGLRSVLQESEKQRVLTPITALAVTSTSGTVIPIDVNHTPLHPAIMYSDPRSAAQGRRIRAVAREFHPKGYNGFNASSGLSKMIWYMETFPEMRPKIAHWIHATDYINGKLSGVWNITDETNALKSGYDPAAGLWPDYLFSTLALQPDWLPEVVPSGTVIGSLLPEVAVQIGLPTEPSSSIAVAAGMTDGCAAQVASGAVRPGDWNATIGTTLVIKGVTRQQIVDPEDRLYNHHHPEGYWMPGGASNTGADWITTDFPGPLAEIEAAAAGLVPTTMMVYPLRQSGERFPFLASGARGFSFPSLMAEAYTVNADADQKDRSALYFAAGMEGVAYLEKMAFTMIEKLSGEPVDRIYAAGGGSNNALWLQIRSSVLQLPVCKMENVTGAVGAAILAASKTHFMNLTAAAAAMTRPEKIFEPNPDWIKSYEKGYRKFVAIMEEKSYIQSGIY
ncbi:MAG TPA: FGGY-family carbohydrate kinase [Arachidicoccus sp.]|nr:FGGY-family carbohydrate kinase [Arachidicoccus sp.]